MNSRNSTIELAEHVVSTRYEDLPGWLREEAKVLIQDWVGVALSGSTTRSGQIAADTWKAMGGNPESTVIGRDFRLPVPGAAFANAIASHSIELDDADDLALFHFSPPTVSVALAVGEHRRSSGREVIVAACLGWEMMARISQATNPSLRDRGFHTTSTCGAFGAAVTAGYLLGLNRDQMVSAIGLSGAEASGLMEFYGTSMQKRYNPGAAALGGTVAALMAANGFTGSETILQGERGFLAAFSDGAGPERLTAGLGEAYPIAIEYKPYATARPIHNAIDCALAVRDQVHGRLDGIQRLVFRRHPDWAHFHQVKTPRTYHEAQVNLPFPVAIALAEGEVFWDQFDDEHLNDPQLRRLTGLVEFVPDPGLSRGVSCHLTVVMEDGSTYEAQVDYPKGSKQNPMTPAEHNRKFTRLAGRVLADEQIDEVLAAIQRLDQEADVNEIGRCLAKVSEKVMEANRS